MLTRRIIKILAALVVIVPLAALPAVLLTDDETLYATLTGVPYLGERTDGIVNRKHKINATLDDYLGGWARTLMPAGDDGAKPARVAGRTRVVVDLPPADAGAAGPPKPPGQPGADRGWGVMSAPAGQPASTASTGDGPAGAPPEPQIESRLPKRAPGRAAPPQAGKAEPLPPPPPPLPMPTPVPMATAKAPPPETAARPPERQALERQAKLSVRAAKAPDARTAATTAGKAGTGQKDDTAEQDHRRGMLYYKGIGVDKDFKKAAMWFRRAADKGHAAAQYNLGIMSYLGQGVEQDYARAAEWFNKAGAQDHAAAQYNLGFLYYEGKGVDKDDLQAYMWIDRSASLGDEKAIKARDTLQKALPKEIFNR